MIAICDYDAGNIRSVQRACTHLGYEYTLTRDRNEILSADHVILPGVGSFGNAMEKLQEYGIDSVLHEVNKKGTPILGICLGLQLFFEGSEESPGVRGLGLMKGNILRIPDHRSVILTPFREWACMFSEQNHLFWFAQITLNILLFIPLGFLLPFQTPKKRISFIKVLLAAFLFSVLIETLQYITSRGITEVDDVINNTLGGVLGWCGQRALRRKLA